MYVPPALTSLISSVPRPYNTSIQQRPPEKLRNAVRPRGGWFLYIIRNVMSLVNRNSTVSNATARADSIPTKATIHNEAMVDKEVSVGTNNSAVIADEKAFENTANTKEPMSTAVTDATTDSLTDGSQGTSTSTDIAGKDLNHSSRPRRNSNQTAQVMKDSAHAAKLRSITLEQWMDDTRPHRPPRVLTLRTVQLAGVGYPIDHLALLWCHELLSVVTSALYKLRWSPSESVLGLNGSSADVDHREKLNVSDTINSKVGTCEDTNECLGNSTTPEAEMKDILQRYGGSGVQERNLEKLFPLKSEFYPRGVPDGLVPPLEAALRREARFKQWSRAGDVEREYFKTLLGPKLGILDSLASIWVVAVVYVTSHLSTILICYILLCMLVMLVPVLRGLCNLKPMVIDEEPWDRMEPWVHFHLDLIYPALITVYNSFYVTAAGDAKRPPNYPQFALFMILIIGIISKIYIDSNSITLFVKRYGFYFEWFVSYGIALLIRLSLLIVITFIRNIIWIFINTLNALWNNIGEKIFILINKSALVKRINLKIMRFLKKWSPFQSMSSILLSVTLISTLLYFGIIYYCKQRLFYDGLKLNLGYAVSFYIVSFTALCISIILAVIGVSGRNFFTVNGGYLGQEQLQDLALLYFPVIILAIPSLHFCQRILFENNAIFLTSFSLFNLFVWDLWLYGIVMMSVTFHVISVAR